MSGYSSGCVKCQLLSFILAQYLYQHSKPQQDVKGQKLKQESPTFNLPHSSGPTTLKLLPRLCFTFMQHEVECAFEICRKELVQEAHGYVQGHLNPWLEEEVEMTCHPGYVIPHVFHLPPFLCLLYFDYKHLAGAAHNRPGRPWPQGASQAQYNAKINNSGGDLQDYKNTGECFTSSVSCCSEITAKGQKSPLHWCPSLPVQQILL